MSLKGVYTPPSSDIEPDAALPPSPPLSPKRISAVDRVLGILRLWRKGRLEGGRRRFRLSAGEFQEFQARLGDLRGFFEDKVRWDFDPTAEEFVLRMPTAVHERFIALVDEAIYTSLRELSKDVQSLKDVYQGRSTTLTLHAPELENSSQSSTEDVILHRSPDATFYHRSRRSLPTCVVEVSYSQQRKDLPRLAESYIVDSRHEIRCVVGLDITYHGKGKRRDKTARVWVCRPGTERDETGEEVGICRCDVDGVVWRDEEGSIKEGALELGVGDFLPEELVKEENDGKSIRIPFAKLAEFLADAEGQDNPEPAATSSTSAPKKFRKRKRSPSEELSDGREAVYLKLEEADLEKEKKVDGEWKGAGWTQAGAEEEAPVEVVQRRRSKRSKSGRAGSEGS